MALLASCGSLRHPYVSRFVTNHPRLGMDKESFVATYGTPYRQNSFFDEDNRFCEELIYREIIAHGGTWYSEGEVRALNSIFFFRSGKLVSQHQEDDWEFQQQLERARERKLIEESIKAEKERAAAEKERAAAEKAKE